MLAKSVSKLEDLCKTAPASFRTLSEAEFTFKPSREKWSKKEILGHLIVSATINHHRFIRGQFETAPTIIYDQNKWNDCSHFNQIGSEQLIQFWTAYNIQLAELIKLIPPAVLKKEVDTGGPNNMSIEAVFIDYVSHLEHHLWQILENY